MASGQQIGELNFQAFLSWLERQTEADFRQMVTRGTLSRKEIAAQCNFAVSALNQNPRIRAALLGKETELRESGILPPKVPQTDGENSKHTLPIQISTTNHSLDVERVRRLEIENAELKAVNCELKRQLEKYAILNEALSTTGRLLR